MPATDDLLRDLWRAVEHAGHLEQQLRTSADEVAAWREVAQAAITALDRECAHRLEEEKRC